jgi:hypothetical protein
MIGKVMLAPYAKATADTMMSVLQQMAPPTGVMFLPMFTALSFAMSVQWVLIEYWEYRYRYITAIALRVVCAE